MPPLPKRGDPEEQTTFAAVGVALSRWEYLEGQLGLLYACLVDAQYASSPALRAYDVIGSFSTRIDMLREATSAFFLGGRDDDLRDEVLDHIETAKKFSPRRNEIAHGIVQQYYLRNESGEHDVGYAIGPSFFAARKKKMTINDLTNNIHTYDDYAYTSKEMKYFADQFYELADDVMRLYLEVAGSASANKSAATRAEHDGSSS